MHQIGSRERRLPAPPHVVWHSLVEPRDERARPWFNLLADETDPIVVTAHEPDRVVWASIWTRRPHDQVHFTLRGKDGGTALRFTLLAPDDDVPDEPTVGHLRKRINQLIFAELRFSYGQ